MIGARVFLLAAVLSVANAVRPLGSHLAGSTARHLLQSFDPNPQVTIQAVQNTSLSGVGPCSFTGLPGSSAPVPGPLIINVYLGQDLKVNFASLGGGAIVALYNQTANVSLISNYNTQNGLQYVEFVANGSTAVGLSAYITAGRINNYDASNPAQSASTPVCLINATFVVANPPNPPSPTPTPTSPPPSPTPTSTPAPTSGSSTPSGGGGTSVSTSTNSGGTSTSTNVQNVNVPEVGNLVSSLVGGLGIGRR